MPAPFRFRLAKVLELREQKEAEMKRLLGEALAVLDVEERRLAELEHAKEHHTGELTRLQRGALDIARVLAYFSFIDQVNDSIARQRDRVQQAKELVDEARVRVTIASQEKKAVEKLRERDFEAWQKEQQRLDTMQLDEASNLRFNRRASSERSSS